VFRCRNVCLSYDGKGAVEDVTFDVSRGDYVCVIGENGSGKSTLMKGILGLMKPVSGRVEFDGLKRNEIGYLPQQTTFQRDFPASVREIVLSGCINRHGPFSFYSRADKARADENIERLGMGAFRHSSYRDLSSGQKQRVLLARALTAADKMLMLDEPASGLDPVATQEMYDLFERLNAGGMTIVMISHDIRSAMRYCGTILHLKRRTLFFGSAEDYVRTDVYTRMKGDEDD
jgi:zinc transport system ATP-binding protein